MRAVTHALLLLFSLMLITACTQDVYPKYLRMKQEAVWMEKTCNEGLAKDTKYVYKGSGASIYITCLKPASLAIWVDSLESDLLKTGWRLIKRSASANVFCLKNQNIYLVVVPNSELEQRNMVMTYPNKLCAEQENNWGQEQLGSDSN